MESKTVSKISFIDPVSKYPVHPWRRYFARMLDISLLTMVLILTGWHLPPVLIKGTYDLAEWLRFPIYILLDIIVLSLFGTTPGKWMFKIRLEDNRGSKVSFKQVFKREAMVYFYGCGLNIPGVSMVTMLRSMSDLESEGIAKWDRKLGLRIVHGNVTIIRWIVFIAMILGGPLIILRWL